MSEGLSCKACTGCGVTKPLTEFSTDKRHSDGRQSRCKACCCVAAKRRREAQPERIRELKRQEYARNKEKIRIAHAAYREANRELLRERARERLAAMTPEERERLREKRRLAQAAYRQRNAEVCAERIRAWQKKNPDKVRAYIHRRRLLQRENGAFEEFTRQEIGDRDGWICALCKEGIDQALRFPDFCSPSLDHIVPLHHGGEHTRANTRITHWICNVARGADRRQWVIRAGRAAR